MSTLEKVHAAIDSLTESARINGVETKMVDFLLNHLAAFADDLAEKYEEDDMDDGEEE